MNYYEKKKGNYYSTLMEMGKITKVMFRFM